MTKYNTIEEIRAAAVKRTMAHYERLKQDPEKYRAFLEKRRKYMKERYAKKKTTS